MSDLQPNICRLDVDSFGETVDYLNEKNIINLAQTNERMQNLCGLVYRSIYAGVWQSSNSSATIFLPKSVKSYSIYSEWDYLSSEPLFCKLTSIQVLKIHDVHMTDAKFDAIQPALKNVIDLTCRYDFLSFIAHKTNLTETFPSLRRLRLEKLDILTDFSILPNTLTCLWVNCAKNNLVRDVYKTLALNSTIQTFIFSGFVKNLNVFHSKRNDSFLHKEGFLQNPVFVENLVLLSFNELCSNNDIETVSKIHRMHKFRHLYVNMRRFDASYMITMSLALNHCLVGLSLQSRQNKDDPKLMIPTSKSTMDRLEAEKTSLSQFTNLKQLTLLWFPYTYYLLDAVATMPRLRILRLCVKFDEVDACLRKVLQLSENICTIIVKVESYNDILIGEKWPLDIKSLNHVRSKIQSFGDKTVDIYVPETMYLSTKWSAGGDTLLEFVRLRRVTALIGNNFINNFSL